MKILIIGANFHNKGGHLMLLSTIEAVKKRFGDAAPVVSYAVGPLEDVEALECGILNFPLLHVSQPQFGTCLVNGMLVSSNRSLDEARVNWEDIDGILDISGFAYSDQWGTVPMQNLRLLTAACKRKRKRLILLPQAFGPFNNPTNRELALQAFPEVDRIFVRDRSSLEHLESLGMHVSEEKIQLAPDITLGYENQRYSREGYCCITPNIRLLDQGKEKWEQDYLRFLAVAMQKVLSETDLHIRILIHDHGGDGRIAEVLERNLRSPRITREAEEDPRAIKRVIAKSQFIIGSRFHALAGALSTGTPAIGLGWSHKYKELFAEYQSESFCYLEPSDTFIKQVDRVTNPSSRAEVSKALVSVGKEVLSRSEGMWTEVEAVLRN